MRYVGDPETDSIARQVAAPPPARIIHQRAEQEEGREPEHGRGHDSG